MSAADTQMQPLDLSCPARQPSPPPAALTQPGDHLLAEPASAVAVVEPAEPPRLPTPTPTTAEAVPLNLTASSPPSSDGDTPTTSGPARKRFLTKYLHKDRGERACESGGRSFEIAGIIANISKIPKFILKLAYEVSSTCTCLLHSLRESADSYFTYQMQFITLILVAGFPVYWGRKYSFPWVA